MKFCARRSAVAAPQHPCHPAIGRNRQDRKIPEGFCLHLADKLSPSMLVILMSLKIRFTGLSRSRIKPSTPSEESNKFSIGSPDWQTQFPHRGGLVNNQCSQRHFQVSNPGRRSAQASTSVSTCLIPHRRHGESMNRDFPPPFVKASLVTADKDGDGQIMALQLNSARVEFPNREGKK